VSISSTFYAHIFCMKVLCAVFSSYILALAEVRKHFRTKKCERKTLMKLTVGKEERITFIRYQARLANKRPVRSSNVTRWLLPFISLIICSDEMTSKSAFGCYIIWGKIIPKKLMHDCENFVLKWCYKSQYLLFSWSSPCYM